MAVFGHEVLGLQVGPGDMKLVQVRLQRTPEVTAYAEAALSSVSEKEHPAGFNVEVAASSLQELLKNKQHGTFRSRDCYLSIPESFVFRKLIEIPTTLTEEEIMPAIRNEAASYLPTDPDAMEIDYQIVLPSAFEKAEEGMHTLAVVAVERVVIQEYVALCQAAKLRPMALDTRAAALMRALVSPTSKDLMVIVSCETETAVVVLVQQGIVWGTASARTSDDVELFSTAIADEIEHITKFYANRTGKAGTPKGIILQGTGTLTALKKALQSQTEAPVHEAKAVATLPDGCDRSYIAAIGGALYPLYGLL